jgi:YD repeat-containing protein
VVEGSGTSAATTRFTYTARGERATITDDRANTWRYGYDWLGRRTSAHDPDAGDSTTAYDGNGKW